MIESILAPAVAALKVNVTVHGASMVPVVGQVWLANVRSGLLEAQTSIAIG